MPASALPNAHAVLLLFSCVRQPKSFASCDLHHSDLEPLVAKFEQESGSQFEVLQVKEKFGGLRIHVNHANDAIHQRIEAAIQESFHTCEVCGQPGELREDSWIKTVCDGHNASEPGAKEIG